MRLLLPIGLLVLASACALRVGRADLKPGASLAGLPTEPKGRADLEAWYRSSANARASSFELDGAVPYVETLLDTSSEFDRVGFFLEPQTFRTDAVLLFLKKADAAPAVKGPSSLRLWGVQLFETATPHELYAPVARMVLRIQRDGWTPPPLARVKLPQDVPLKTPTLTFHRDQLFGLWEGRIWFKRNPSLEGALEEPWRLFGDGLPFPADGRPEFERPARIAALSADADDLVAVDDTGRAFICTTESRALSSVNGWSDGWGFPGKRPLRLDERAAHAKGFAVGRRAEHVVWFEDGIGNRHNWGPMGTTTFYLLHQSGQELLFTDNGLPNDFSRELCGPDDGRFVAEGLSASATAVMLIDRYGRVLTQFNDYDVNGGTPNFEYTYRSEVFADRDPESLRTSLLPYYLPLVPWRWHEPVRLLGQARLSTRITILQTGVGNSARELRIGARGPGGELGYFVKTLDADEWRFVADPAVQVPDEAWLENDDVLRGAVERATTGADVTKSALPRGKSYRASWKGTLKLPKEGALSEVPDVEVTLDWNPYCPPGRLTFHTGADAFDVTLHTVDFWSPAHRHRPGFDGSPMLLLGTLVFDDAVLLDQRRAVRALVEQLRPFHHQNFALLLALDQGRLEVRALDDGIGETHPFSLALTRDEPYDPPEPALEGVAARADSLEWLRSTDVLDLVDAAPFAVEPQGLSREELARAIEKNDALFTRLMKLWGAYTEQERDLQDFLKSIRFIRPVTGVMALGRVPRLPKLLSMQWSDGRVVTVQAEAKWQEALKRLSDRLNRLRAAAQ